LIVATANTASPFDRQPDQHPLRLRMLDDIVQLLLYDAEQRKLPPVLYLFLRNILQVQLDLHVLLGKSDILNDVFDRINEADLAKPRRDQRLRDLPDLIDGLANKH